MAFEAEFFGLNDDIEQALKGTIGWEDFVKQYISFQWSECNGCSTLFYRYLPSTLSADAPLILTGFDNITNTRKLVMKLDSIIHVLKLPIANTKEYSESIFPLIQAWFNYTKDSTNNKKVNNYLTEIKNQMLEKLHGEHFWIKSIENFISLNQMYFSGNDHWAERNLRDDQMAKNLKWLSEIKYSNQKIIVWAHNYHVSKYSGHYGNKYMNSAITMGTAFTADTNTSKQTYIIGFTSREGYSGVLGKQVYEIKKRKNNSFENWINKSYEYAFVDFKNFNGDYDQKPQPFLMFETSKDSRYRYHASEWAKVFDGIFYIKTMYPCKR